MADTSSMESILAKVRENKEVLEKTRLELEAARQAVEQLGSEVMTLREEIEQKNQSITDKNEVIEDLIAQNQELQESLARYQADWESMRSVAEEKDRLMEELNTLLA